MFDSLDEELRAGVGTWESRPGGWQTLQFDFGTWDDADLPALVEWSKAPACVTQVSDSDLALVTGLDTAGQRWQAWLNLDIAARLLAEEPEGLEDQLLWLDTPEFHDAVRHKHAELDAEIPTDAAGAVAWAAAAGIPVTPQTDRIEELLRSHETPVEDLFSTLLDELGFPPGH
ncbi:hypothetical protein H0H10_20525 [Streptomyces sp. TRM S81-3]|uniref:Uncharacterized protein n=1 Tax=Streptomyces griseicoloratus TaxID=2752516 RepID=A0A926QS03_9ACTN|nr:hypothetical protein [Streptomyces griseicoloratus]MBD0421511.1 hypothetical protein [Streptomyces griseicoloratus]